MFKFRSLAVGFRAEPSTGGLHRRFPSGGVREAGPTRGRRLDRVKRDRGISIGPTRGRPGYNHWIDQRETVYSDAVHWNSG